MEKWYVVVEQNGGEYYGHFEVEANDVRLVNERSICADGVIVRFDEKIDGFEKRRRDNVEDRQTSHNRRKPKLRRELNVECSNRECDWRRSGICTHCDGRCENHYVLDPA